ncbi:hypothetical protein Micbo1qcDRAFT_229992 [Microdochium bolleyi]|uniref:Uncharacterized protein n=1 Tax=Microdochium bolleyi TaxID=196109 RepID=A0A136JJG6_9PEZI|nr:hypothetical protein Micbo1qcDRAFT_229992 [Microdochium bolleyi]
MRVSTATLATLLLGAASAAPASPEPVTDGKGFKLPANLEDGFYRAYHDESGREVHERVSGPASAQELAAVSAAVSDATVPDSEPTGVSSIQGSRSRYWCGCGLSMNHGDCDAAVEDLKFQSDREYGKPEWERNHLIAPGTSWYSIRGSVVAFSCNWYWAYMPIPRRDGYTNVFGYITRECGWYVPGTWVNDDSGSVHVGYMNYRAGLDFCMDATRSNDESC